eukprot:Skav219872  [mRNA]  locus=scaffold777:177303:178461:+ [translate_table: standard]
MFCLKCLQRTGSLASVAEHGEEHSVRFQVPSVAEVPRGQAQLLPREVFTVSEVAGIMAAKRTPDLLPLIGPEMG